MPFSAGTRPYRPCRESECDHIGVAHLGACKITLNSLGKHDLGDRHAVADFNGQAHKSNSQVHFVNKAHESPLSLRLTTTYGTLHIDTASNRA